MTRSASSAARVSRKTVTGPNRRLKLVARFGVGYDAVDVAACTEQGILLTIAPDGVRRPVASSVMAFTLAMAHRLATKDRLMRDGRWKEKGDYLGYGLTGKVLGVIGVGNIGKEVFRLAKPWDMVHLGCDPYVPQAAVADLGVKMVDLDTLLREADVISVNCLLNDETQHLIGAREFGLMKPSAFFINTARGPVVDEAGADRGARIASASPPRPSMCSSRSPRLCDNPLLEIRQRDRRAACRVSHRRMHAAARRERFHLCGRSRAWTPAAPHRECRSPRPLGLGRQVAQVERRNAMRSQSDQAEAPRRASRCSARLAGSFWCPACRRS